MICLWFYGIFLPLLTLQFLKSLYLAVVTFILLEIEVPNPVDQNVHSGFSQDL